MSLTDGITHVNGARHILFSSCSTRHSVLITHASTRTPRISKRMLISTTTVRSPRTLVKAFTSIGIISTSRCSLATRVLTWLLRVRVV